MKKSSKKLALHRDTLHVLETRHAQDAVGGDLYSGEYGGGCPSLPPNCVQATGLVACASKSPICVNNNG